MSCGRLPRLLLRLYSRHFRESFGEAALGVLRRDLHEAGLPGGGGRPRRAALLAEFAWDGVIDRGAAVLRALSPDGGFWAGWSQDLRVSLRSSVRRVGFSTVAVVSLAVGLGANAVVFALADTFLLRDIPGVSEPERLVELSLVHSDGGRTTWNVPDFEDIASRATGLESAALFDRGVVSFGTEAGRGEQLLALHVTSGYFATVGVPLALGRGFSPEMDEAPGAHPFVVLSHRTWTERFDADPGVVGRTVRLNRTPYTVVGVTPEAFRGHQFGLDPSVYLPLTQSAQALRDPERFFGSRGTLWAGAIGRLSPEATPAQLNASLQAVTASLAEAHPRSNAGRSAHAVPAALLPAEGRGAASLVFGLLPALMLLVLAATAANVGGMLLARASAREREMAVRMALGSGRARVVRHLLTESMVLFVLGGVGGVALAAQGMRAFGAASRLPTFLPVHVEFGLDWRATAFGLALLGLVGLVFGLLPALTVTRGGIQAGLRDGLGNGGLRASRLRRLFVAGQVAVSVLLLSSSILFLRSLRNTAAVDPGFSPEGVYLTGFDLALEGYDDPARAEIFVDELLARIRTLPGVAGATVAGDFPLDGGSSTGPVYPGGAAGAVDAAAPERPEGASSSPGGAPPARFVRSHFAQVSDGYFETLGMPRRAGRVFEESDGRDTPRVAVVNEVLAERLWPGESPLGRSVVFGLAGERYEVVGVVGATSTNRLTDDPGPQIFTLLQQDPEADLHIAVRRGPGAGDGFVLRVRQEMLALDPALALSPTLPLSDLAELAMLPQRVVATVAGVLGSLALLLSAMGIYGVVAFAVTRRTREIGIRMALGSTRRRVLTGVVWDGLRLGLPGLVVGIPLAGLVTLAARALLVGVSPLDPTTWASVSGLFLLVVAGASWAPARRASTVQPMEALRSD